MLMTVPADEVRDWTYRDARHRLVRAARARLPQHAATARLDDDGNRLVECGCGWRGNGLGWVGHLDSVVRAALDSERPG
jgi:cyclopropane fatty-acyl-phospholipid synthase-like methyltransferase